MKLITVACLASIAFLFLASCSSDGPSQKEYDELIVSNHANIEIVTMSLPKNGCQNDLVQEQGGGFYLLVPTSALSCAGFLASYYNSETNMYNHPDMIALAKNADRQCKYKKSIDLTNSEANSDNSQYRIGVLRYNTQQSFIMNAMRAKDYDAAGTFRTTLNNYKNTCLNMINHAREIYYD